MAKKSEHHEELAYCENRKSLDIPKLVCSDMFYLLSSPRILNEDTFSEKNRIPFSG